MTEIIYLVFAYLLGAIPTGLTLAKIKKIDITKVGSGNVGATNVTRALGKKYGVITLIIDILKGALAISIALLLKFPEEIVYLSALAAVLGHCISLPMILTGGKGVATTFGATLALAPLVALSALIVFAITYKVTKIVSLASIIASISLPVLAWIFIDQKLALHLLIIAAIIIYKHRSNITKLINGEEKTFSLKP